jgi:hypothetical protein
LFKIFRRENLMSEYYEIVPCNNGVGEWEISPIHETFDTRQQAEERLEELKLNNYISQFKDGVSDALLLGKSADVNLTSAYKQGYDFGITIYCEMEGLDD